jgi:hypothetical protein
MFSSTPQFKDISYPHRVQEVTKFLLSVPCSRKQENPWVSFYLWLDASRWTEIWLADAFDSIPRIGLAADGVHDNQD